VFDFKVKPSGQLIRLDFAPAKENHAKRDSAESDRGGAAAHLAFDGNLAANELGIALIALTFEVTFIRTINSRGS